MPPRTPHLANVFLRFAAPLRSIRRFPALGNWLSRVAQNVVPRDQLVWAKIHKGPAAGLWLQVNPRTGSELLQGAGEPEVQNALELYLQPGTIFYDLGANIGFFSLLAARLVGPGGRVFSFEADLEVAARLRENAAQNAMSWITVQQCAVWSESRRVLFLRADPRKSPDRGLGHIVDSRAADAIEIEAVSLDSFCLQNPAPDFIKCDVEGAELEVIRGARQLLAEKRPRLLCEIHSDANRVAFISELSALRYACEPCGDRHILAWPQ